jgi:hypothetical protein
LCQHQLRMRMGWSESRLGVRGDYGRLPSTYTMTLTVDSWRLRSAGEVSFMSTTKKVLHALSYSPPIMTMTTTKRHCYSDFTPRPVEMSSIQLGHSRSQSGSSVSLWASGSLLKITKKDLKYIKSSSNGHPVANRAVDPPRRKSLTLGGFR